MSNSAIQQSLIDIEQNLRKLESARSQVEGLAHKSEQLSSLVANLIESIEAIKISYEDAESSLQQNFEKSLIKFEGNLSETIHSVDIKSKEFLSNQESFITKAVDNLKDIDKNLLETKKSIQELDLEKRMNSIKVELSEIKEQVNSNHNKTFSNLLKVQSLQRNLLILSGVGFFVLTILIILF